MVSKVFTFYLLFSHSSAFCKMKGDLSSKKNIMMSRLVKRVIDLLANGEKSWAKWFFLQVFSNLRLYPLFANFVFKVNS